MPTLMIGLIAIPFAACSWFMAAVFALNILLVEGTVNPILLGYAIAYAPWIVVGAFLIGLIFVLDLKPADIPPATNHRIFQNTAYVAILAFAPIATWIPVLAAVSALMYECKVAHTRQLMGLRPGDTSPFSN